MNFIEVKSKMLMLRDQAVLLDRDVAAIYGVETRAVNQAVKRNRNRFPEGYVFRLDKDECSRSQSVTLNKGRGANLKYAPYAFTERGLYMLATIELNLAVLKITHEVTRKKRK